MRPSTELNPFDSAKATPEALEVIRNFREAYKTLQSILDNTGDTVIVNSRSMALAMTNLEQSAMWAIKAISHANVQE